MDDRARARLLAAGPLPPLRRRHHVLGARRDRQGARRDPRVRRARRSRLEARGSRRRRRGRRVAARPPRAARRASPAEAQTDREESFSAWQRFIESIAARWAARPPLRRPPLGGRRAARVRRAARRLVVRPADPRPLHGAARALREPSRVGRRQAQLDDGRAVAAVAGGDRAARRGPPRCCRPAGGDAGCAPRPGRWQPAVRGGVRAAVPRARLRRGPAAARHGPGAHRRAARHAAAGPEGVAPGCGRHRQGLLGRSARVDERARRQKTSARAFTSWRGRSSCGPHGSRPSKVRPSTRSGTR